MHTKFPSCSPTPEGLGMLLIHWDHLQRSREAHGGSGVARSGVTSTQENGTGGSRPRERAVRRV